MIVKVYSVEVVVVVIAPGSAGTILVAVLEVARAAVVLLGEIVVRVK